MIKIAVIQMQSGTDVEKNVNFVLQEIKASVQQGVQIVFTPEMTSLLEGNSEEFYKKIKTEDEDLALKTFKDAAKEYNVTLVIGSLPIHIFGDKPVNRCYCIDNNGEVVTYYDKIHMYDVNLGGDQVFLESEKYAHGNTAKIARTSLADIGLTVCYDVRFPNLYTDLALAGAQILSIPASFFAVTGKSHWEILIRARAIETGSFVVAAAQAGKHEDGRETWGHSLVVNPWGEVISEANGTTPETLILEINLDEVKIAREKIPNLKNIKKYSLIG